MVQRSKITELYCLHVLPRVGDWEYAKEFTQISTDIDDEQREVRALWVLSACDRVYTDGAT